MNIIAETFYSYYILQFLDNNIKICQSIDETSISQSIEGRNADSFHQIHDESYQFIFTENHCVVKPLRLIDKSYLNVSIWSKPFILLCFENFLKNKTTQIQDSIINEKINQEILYVKKVNFKINYILFEKIINDPNCDKKSYSANDIFHICYSHAFSFLDNHLIILKNMLYLILHGLFDLDDIHCEFLKYASKNYENNEYFNKFKNSAISMDNTNMPHLIDQFLTENHNFKKNDAFLDELFNWNIRLINLFSLIRQTFCFQIKKNEYENLMKIHYNKNYESLFDIPVERFELFMAFISDECIFICEYFSLETNRLFSCILRQQQFYKLQINITDFYSKLYSSANTKITQECINLNIFFTQLFIERNLSITLIIYSNKFNLEKNHDNFKLTRLNGCTTFNINKSVLISASILMRNFYGYKYLLRSIAEMILLYSVCQELGNDVEVIFFNQNLNILQFDHSKNKYNWNSLSDNSTKKKRIEIVRDGSTEISIIDGNFYEGRDIICIGKYNQKYCNLDLLTGIFDENVSMFVIDSQTSKLSISNNLVEKLISESSTIENLDLDRFSQNFALFELDANINKYLVFHLDITHQKPEKDKLTFSHINSSDDILNCFECNQKLLVKPYIEKSTSEKQVLKIHHNKINSIRQNHLNEPENCPLILYPQSQHLNNLYFDFEIQKSNFHLIIFRVMDCKSIDRKLSSVFQKNYLSYHQLIVNHCHVKFLDNSFHKFNLILLRNCKIHFFSVLFSDTFSAMQLNINFYDFQLSSTIMISDFAKIEPKNDSNTFHLCRNKNREIFELIGCKMTIFTPIPQYISVLKLSKCEIVVSGNIFESNLNLSSNYLTKSDKSTEPIRKQDIVINGINSLLDFWIRDCILPNDLQISGLFYSIMIENCVSSFNIDSNCEKIKIKNHHGEYSVYPYIDRAHSLYEDSCMKIYEKNIYIRNLTIKNLFKMKNTRIFTQNCNIEKITTFKL